MTKLKTEDFPGGVVLHLGDCLEVMAELPDNSVDSCVTDPPYHLASIVKRYAKGDAKTERSIRLHGEQKVSPFMRGARGFMGKKWDGGDVAFRVETWTQVFRVMKPGAFLVAFGGTRTYHRMACAIEDAGFEVRDMISWMYGSGFPKSHDLSKGIDRALGVKGTYAGPKSDAHAGWIDRGRMRGGEGHDGWQSDWMNDPEAVDRNARRYIPASPEAQAFVGFGTAIKPACEPIALARKPLSEKTVAANVLKWGTGALNIDGCRIATDETIEATRNIALGSSGSGIYGTAQEPGVYEQNANGRWPANVVHDGSPEVVEAFPDSSGGHWSGETPSLTGKQRMVGEESFDEQTGSAARFFYTAKADSDDRLGSKHPTIKPVDLIQWLVRLVTPPKGIVFDPFAGTGTAAEAAIREGMHAWVIEREPEYQDDIRRRMRLAFSGPVERTHESIKAKYKDKPVDNGPLFGGTTDAA